LIGCSAAGGYYFWKGNRKFGEIDVTDKDKPSLMIEKSFTVDDSSLSGIISSNLLLERNQIELTKRETSRWAAEVSLQLTEYDMIRSQLTSRSNKSLVVESALTK
jgi:hypothetical protein